MKLEETALRTKELDIVIGEVSVSHLVSIFEEKRGSSLRKSRDRAKGLEEKETQDKKDQTLEQENQTVYIDVEETI